MTKYPDIKKKFIKEFALKYKLYVPDGEYFESDAWEDVWSFFEQSLQETEKRVREEMVDKIKRLYGMYGAHDAIDIAHEKGLVSPGLAYQQGHIDGQLAIINGAIPTLLTQQKEEK